MSGCRVFISAGEVSGDIAGARLVDELRRLCPTVSCSGLGGRRLRAAGVDIAVDTNRLGAVGFTEAVRAAPGLLDAFRRVRRQLRAQPADVAVLIGNDLFNVLLGRWLRRAGVPTVAYFPPQVWIWRVVLPLMATSFDVVLACFDQEAAAYARAGARVVFVGHHLAERLVPVTDRVRDAARSRLALGSADPVVGLLPGSRQHEVVAIGRPLLDAARQLHARAPGIRFILPVSDPPLAAWVRRALDARGLTAAVVVVSDSHHAMQCADLLLMASGTASLEASLLEVPMVTLYRLSAVSYGLVRCCLAVGLLRDSPLALPNVLLGEPIVPELHQAEVRPARIAEVALELLGDAGRRETMRSRLGAVRDHVRCPDGLTRAAAVVLEVGGWRPAGGAIVAPSEASALETRS